MSHSPSGQVLSSPQESPLQRGHLLPTAAPPTKCPGAHAPGRGVANSPPGAGGHPPPRSAAQTPADSPWGTPLPPPVRSLPNSRSLSALRLCTHLPPGLWQGRGVASPICCWLGAWCMRTERGQASVGGCDPPRSAAWEAPAQGVPPPGPWPPLAQATCPPHPKSAFTGVFAVQTPSRAQHCRALAPGPQTRLPAQPPRCPGGL